MLYTAQYRYGGSDRLDITVKGNDLNGKMFAPTWDMVNQVKDGSMSEEEYTDRYYKLLNSKWSGSFKTEVLSMVEKLKGEDITIVCFCATGKFCHRYLLANWLCFNFGVEYGGERSK